MGKEADFHSFVLVKQDGGPDWGSTLRFPRVSTIVKTVSAVEPLNWWAFRTGLQGVSQVMRDMGDGVEKAQPILPGDSAEEIEAILKERGLRHIDQRDKAGERGTALHKVAERLAQGETVEPETPWEEGLVKWWVENQPDLIESEKFVSYFTGPHDGFAGSFDSKIEVQLPWPMEGTQRLIVDYKTRKKAKERKSNPLTPYETEWLQTGGYWLADGAVTGVGTAIFVIDGDGNTQFHIQTDPSKDAEAFLKVFEVYRYLHPQKA